MLHGLFTSTRYPDPMYEGPIKAANTAREAETPILRQMRWTDLVARLAATRDQRAAPAEPAGEQPASFAAFHQCAMSDGDRPVNRDALTHGKFARLPASDTADTETGRDREI